MYLQTAQAKTSIRQRYYSNLSWLDNMALIYGESSYFQANVVRITLWGSSLALYSLFPVFSFCLSILYELTTMLLRTQYCTMEMRLTQTISELTVIQEHLQTIAQLNTQYTKMIAELAIQSNVIEVCAKDIQQETETIGQLSAKIDDDCRQIQNAAQEFFESGQLVVSDVEKLRHQTQLLLTKSGEHLFCSSKQNRCEDTHEMTDKLEQSQNFLEQCHSWIENLKKR